MPEEDTQKMQNKVDKLKTLSLANNIHNLSPPSNPNSQIHDVAIVEALKADRHIQKAILQLKGYMFDPLKNVYAPYRRPVMNELGIGNFIQTIQNIGDTIEFSNFKEDDIPKFAIYLFEYNYPYFTIYYRDYELSREDFNLVSTILIDYILTSLYKAKGGGHRNVVRGTYSEDLLGKVVQPEFIRKEGGFGALLGRLNPMRRN